MSYDQTRLLANRLTIPTLVNWHNWHSLLAFNFAIFANFAFLKLLHSQPFTSLQVTNRKKRVLVDDDDESDDDDGMVFFPGDGGEEDRARAAAMDNQFRTESSHDLD